MPARKSISNASAKASPASSARSSSSALFNRIPLIGFDESSKNGKKEMVNRSNFLSYLRQQGVNTDGLSDSDKERITNVSICLILIID